jgi:hypothetical protein
MKRITLALMLIVALVGCNQNSSKTAQTTIEAISPTDVVVFYFHGKQRCKTCVAVGDVARETVKEAFADNDKVRFIEINTSEKSNDALIEKYEVTWNALIIAKGENSVDITNQAFSTAVKNPQSLENLIKKEVNKRLQ